MKTILLALTLATMLATPLLARNIAVPENNPVAIVKVPDDWKIEEIEYGDSAVSPDKDIFFSVESADKANVDAMMKNNKSWMKENKIDDSVDPKSQEMTFGGIDGKVFRFDTTDENGPTRVDFVVLPTGDQRVIFLTLWGSGEERAKHSSEIDAIMNSVKAIR